MNTRDRIDEAPAASGGPGPDPAGRWRMLAVLCPAIVMTMTTWFSATAILPELVAVWHLTPSQAAWLTNGVQIGFVCGALGASGLNLPDLVAPRRLMSVGAALAGLANLSLLAAPSVGTLVLARVVTGLALAAVYPPALKLVSTWFRAGRGLALGALIAALTIGSASPHLLRVVEGRLAWQGVVLASSLACVAGAVLLGLFGTEGPFRFGAAPFDPRQIGAALRNKALGDANLGYFGHMWELYAMWGWMLAYAGEMLPRLGLGGARSASLFTFVVIASGGGGALLGGFLADRVGRTLVAGAMMLVSGSCALAVGAAASGPPWLFVAVCIVWGISVIGDSAQFSAMATEVSDARYVGTALALQLGIGFALTLVSIRLTPVVAGLVGWRWSFAMLAPGPFVGVLAMARLRRRPEALRIAGGRR